MIQAGALLVVLLMMLSVTALVVLSSPQPVEAVAGDDVTVDVGQEVAFDASASTGAEPVQFLWFFGNGDAELGGLPSLSTEPETTFAYLREGVYETILIVTDGLGRVDVDSRVVTVRNVLPAAVLRVDAFAGEEVEVQEDEAIAFDGSRSEDTEDLMYDWDFGDGDEGAGAMVEHAYASQGTYVARLEVMDPKGAKDRAAVVVQVRNVAPEAAASFPSEAAEDELLIFDASATVDTPSDLAKLTYIWDLGDGTVELGRQVEHAYGLSGAYRIRLRVIDDNGASSQVEGFLTIRNQPPIAVLPPLVVVEEEATVFFDASASTDTPSDVPLLNYSWDFDLDGKADAFGRRVTQVFDDEGDCLVRLVVQDDDGARASALTLVRVLDDEEDDPDELEDDEDDECAEEDDEDDDRLTVFEDEVVTFRPEDEDDGAVTFRWIFRDGTEAVGRVVEHAFAQAGTYHVLLVTTDEEREVEIDEFEVRVRNVPPWARIAPIGPAVEDALLLFDGRGTVDTPSDLPTLQYRWTFGDGSLGVGPVVSHAYPRAGRYAATLVVQDDNGAFSEASVEIAVGNVAPVASFDGPATVFVEEPALFVSTSEDTLSDEAALEIAWTLGDGTTAAGRELVHAFLAPGTFSVELAVTDDDGEVDLVAGTVEVQNRPPTAHIPFDLFMVYGEEGRASFRGLGFNGLSDQGSLSFSWDFGDGSSGEGGEVEHAYGTSGSFMLTLTVKDRHGAVGTDTAVVNVILDRDLDGLPDQYESQVADTDPAAADTDEDGILDPFEILVFGTDPLLQDTDFDAWTDFEEVFAVHGFVTDPLDPDGDGDGMLDGQEVYTRTFVAPKRVRIDGSGSFGTQLSNVGVSATSPVVQAIAIVGISGEDVSHFAYRLRQEESGAERWLWQAGTNPRATNNVSSFDLLDLGFAPAVFTSPHTWNLTVFQNATEDTGYLEAFQVSITVRTNPTDVDDDDDGLLDGGPRVVSSDDVANITLLNAKNIHHTEEEGNVTYWGEASFGTDPWSGDTDGDSLSDTEEIFGLGVPKSDPLKADTDGDGTGDAVDLDPLNNLMVKVTLKRIHHGTACFFTPTLQGVIQVGERTFFSERKVADREKESEGLGCLTLARTAVFENVYHADVPDKQGTVSVVVEAWEVIAGDVSVELLARNVPYSLGDPRITSTRVDLENGHKFTVQVETFAPPRINVVAVFDENATVAVDDVVHYPPDNRYFVLQVNATSAAGPFVKGFNVVVAPWELYLNSFLLGRLQNASTEPFNDDTAFYGDDPDQAEVSYFLPGMIAGNLTGAEAQQALTRLLQNFTGETVYRFTVPGSDVLLMGLPPDVLKLVPYQGYVDSPQDAAPVGSIWEGIANFFADVGNALVGGFLALANFLSALVSAALEFGVRVLAFFSSAAIETVNSAIAKIGNALTALVQHVIDLVVSFLEAALAPLFEVVETWQQESLESLTNLISEILLSESTGSASKSSSHTVDLIALMGTVLQVLVFGSGLFLLFLAVGIAFQVLEITTKAFSFALSGLIGPVVVAIIKGLIIGAAITEILGAFTGNVIDLLPSNFGETTPFVFALADVVLAGVAVAVVGTELFGRMIPPLAKPVLALALAALSFILLGLAIQARQIALTFGFEADGIVANFVSVLVDVIAVFLAVKAAEALSLSREGKAVFPLFYSVSQATTAIAVVSSVSGTIVDSVELGVAIARGEF